jgi:putative salt-induced outer membrane protein YdiY
MTTLQQRLLPLLLLAPFCASSHAIVTMESLHTLKPASGFSGQLDLSLNGSEGSTDKQEYGVATRLQWHQPERYTNFLLLDGSYGEVNGVTNTEKGFIHGRHIRPLTGKLDGELFAQAEKNRFSRLTLRTLAGGGARLTLIDRPEQGLVIGGLGAFWSREEIDDSYADEGSDTRWRANGYLVAKYRFSPTAQLTNTLYYQPALDEMADYRLIEQFGLSVTLTDALSLGFAIDHAYDSRPPTGVDQAQMSYKTTLGIRF